VTKSSTSTEAASEKRCFSGRDRRHISQLLLRRSEAFVDEEKVGQLSALAVLKDLEIVDRQTGDRPPVVVADADLDVDDRDLDLVEEGEPPTAWLSGPSS
jgi:hypothetical protein